MKQRSIFFVALAAALFITSASAQHQTTFSSFGNDRNAVQQLEEQWNAATLRGDVGAMQRILGEDYTLVTPEGEALPKAQAVALFKDMQFDSLSTTQVKTKVYVGSAVVTGMATLKGKYKNTDISGDYLFVHIFEPGKDGWKAVYEQLTKVKPAK